MNNLIFDSLEKLRKKKIMNPELDLRIILKKSSKKNKDIFLSNINTDEINIKTFNNLLSKRLQYQPISKILKIKHFWKNEFYVNNQVLDPRPESEIIIEEALKIYKNKNQKLKILDIGTGSGCLSISLANEYKQSHITAIDISKQALKVAQKNIHKFNLEKRIQLKLINMEFIKNKFDLIISNPPYLSDNDYNNCQTEIKKYEPKLALLGGKDGLKFYRIYSNILHKIMNKGSYFICEIGNQQLSQCIKIFEKSKLSLINTKKDLQNIERTMIFTKI